MQEYTLIIPKYFTIRTLKHIQLNSCITHHFMQPQKAPLPVGIMFTIPFIGLIYLDQSFLVVLFLLAYGKNAQAVSGCFSSVILILFLQLFLLRPFSNCLIHIEEL